MQAAVGAPEAAFPMHVCKTCAFAEAGSQVSWPSCLCAHLSGDGGGLAVRRACLGRDMLEVRQMRVRRIGFGDPIAVRCPMVCG